MKAKTQSKSKKKPTPRRLESAMELTPEQLKRARDYQEIWWGDGIGWHSIFYRGLMRTLMWSSGNRLYTGLASKRLP